jgi:hypothetical protein
MVMFNVRLWISLPNARFAPAEISKKLSNLQSTVWCSLGVKEALGKKWSRPEQTRGGICLHNRWWADTASNSFLFADNFSSIPRHAPSASMDNFQPELKAGLVLMSQRMGGFEDCQRKANRMMV